MLLMLHFVLVCQVITRRLAYVRKRRLTMTSLIDVIFLLLLFFMLSSTFSREAEFPIDLAASGTQTKESLSDVLLVINTDQWLLGGEPVVLDQLDEALQQLGEGRLLIRLDEQVDAQTLAGVLHLMRQRPEWQVAVLGDRP